jgi:hypothetical protein
LDGKCLHILGYDCTSSDYSPTSDSDTGQNAAMRPEPHIIFDHYRFTDGRLSHGMNGVIMCFGNNGHVRGDENTVPDGYAASAPDMEESRDRTSLTDEDFFRMLDNDRVLHAKSCIATAQNAP